MEGLETHAGMAAEGFFALSLFLALLVTEFLLCGKLLL